MAVNFQDRFVKWSYRIETQDNDDPSRQNLIAWDVTLHNRYDQHLNTAMNAAGIPTTRRNRSLIAMLALASTGTMKEQVENACEFWPNVRGMVL